MTSILRPTHALIDLACLRHNVRAIRARVGAAEIMGVVKADSYGLGAVACSGVLWGEGVRRFAVALVEEGVALRRSGLRGRMLILGALTPGQAEEIAARRFEAVVSDLSFARALDRAAGKAGRQVSVHLKFDTGMGRIGFCPEDAAAVFERIRRLRGVRVAGVMTHFAVSDEAAGGEFTREQVRRFLAVRAVGLAVGLKGVQWHAANSGGIFHYPESHLDAVRPGIALYGGYPGGAAPRTLGLKPVLTLRTRIAQVREVGAGESISYGRTFIARRPSRIAVLPLGYADGYRRLLSNRGEVLVRGRRAPVTGRVCMDMVMADVTEVCGVRAGDEVVLIGRQGGEEISVQEVAAHVGTNEYEVLTALTARVPRVYKHGAAGRA